jgi:hypothetical protein
LRIPVGKTGYSISFADIFPMKNHLHHTATIAKAYSGSGSRIRGWLLLLLLSLPFFSPAQQASDYTVQANIIYHFTKYIDWPPAKKSGEFIIGVFGDSPLYEELQKSLANKSVGNQKIVIKKITSVEAIDCHILFVSEEMSKNMKKIVTQTTSKSVLLVSEKEGLAKKGGCINFIIVSDRLKLEINKTNIEQRNLSIASELLKLGKVVN